MTVRDLAELVRAPAGLTVPGDTLAGAASAGWPAGRRTALLPLASVSLYWAGMALNDWADRDLDALERPERPIPSGRVTPGTALALASGLTATGVGLAARAGGAPAAAVAGVLAGAVWTYDLSAKSGPASTAVMASTRGLDVLLGAAAGGLPALRQAIAPAALLAVHTAGVTALSRGEVHGTKPATARGALCATTVVTTLIPVLASARALALAHSLAEGRAGRGRGSRDGWVATGVAIAAATAYASSVGRAQVAAVTDPGAATTRRATVAGIKGMVPLQSALVASAGEAGAALALGALSWVARSAMRKGSPT
ncbi:SCO3242 family prenyltransferase [Knoellia sp. CPCC 206453]|uniref:SCO3242 family prenyltransferase n=1 Tax=Knoellia pratensis TaxID=3404796 RepID=UPI00360DC499